MTRTRYKIYETTHPYFLTCTVVGWLPIFTRPQAVEIIYESWRFLQSNDRLELFGYVILENHLHLIAAGEALPKEIGDFKSYTARRIIDLLKSRHETMILDQLSYHKERHKVDRKYQLWQEGSHPKKIENEEMMRQKLEYMHANPQKHGYVDRAEHWRYSSARNYAGLDGLIDVTTRW